MNTRLRVLLWYPTVAYFNSLLRIANALKKRGAEPIIHAPSYFPGTAEFEAKARASGVAYLCFMKPDLSGYLDSEQHIRKLGLWADPTPRAKPTRMYQEDNHPKQSRMLISNIVQLANPEVWKSKHDELFTQWRRLNDALLDSADFLIDRMGIDIFFSPDETLDYNSQYFIASMRAAGKRSIFIPLATPSANEVDDVLINNESHVAADACQQSFARNFPNWVRKVDGVQLIRMPLGRAAALEYDGLAPHYPWLSFTSDSDVVGLNSPYLRDRLVELGGDYRRSSMFVIGSPEDDDVSKAAAHRQELRSELSRLFSWTEAKPIALVNPVGYLGAEYRLPEFDSYHELLRFWLQSLSKLTAFNVVVSPHPSFKFYHAEREILEAEARNIAWRGVAELIPACDLYVSYGGSSTVRLAASAGLPVLNYLCYDVSVAPEDEKSYFVGFNSILIARSRQEFMQAIEQLNDHQNFTTLAHHARNQASYFGAGAGDFSRRLMSLMQELTRFSGRLSADNLNELGGHLER